MSDLYLASFSLALFISFVATVWVTRLALKKKILDVPDDERRFHKEPTPELGGLAVYISFVVVVAIVGFLGGQLLTGNIPILVLVGIVLGGGILMIGGYLDDKYRLPAKVTIFFPTLASLVIVAVGVTAVSIHNPFTGDVILVDGIKHFGLPIVSGLVVFVWTMTMTYTTKVLDGMDGLVAGITAIGALVLFGLSLTPEVRQPQTALLCIILAGSMLGFLILNFYPARIFLGEGGSTFAGFMLAVLAVVSGGKIATALLVMGIPLLDFTWVVLERIFSGQSPFSGDRRHLHFRLTGLGLSQSQAVLLLYALTGIFGASALLLQSKGKFIALIIMLVVVLAIVASLYAVYRNKKTRNP